MSQVFYVIDRGSTPHSSWLKSAAEWQCEQRFQILPSDANGSISLGSGVTCVGSFVSLESARKAIHDARHR